jgi:hypothetical protein
MGPEMPGGTGSIVAGGDTLRYEQGHRAVGSQGTLTAANRGTPLLLAGTSNCF